MTEPFDLNAAAKVYPTARVVDRVLRRPTPLRTVVVLGLSSVALLGGAIALFSREWSAGVIAVWCVAMLLPAFAGLAFTWHASKSYRGLTKEMTSWSEDHSWSTSIPAEHEEALSGAVLVLPELPVPRGGALRGSWTCDGGLASCTGLTVRVRCFVESTRVARVALEVEHKQASGGHSRHIQEKREYFRQARRLWQSATTVDVAPTDPFTFTFTLPDRTALDTLGGTHLRARDPRWWELEIELTRPEGTGLARHVLPIYGPLPETAPVGTTTAPAGAAQGHCPRCREPALVDGGCPRCGGRLATAAEVESFLADRLRISREMLVELAGAQGVDGHPCPSCTRGTRRLTLKGMEVEPCLGCGCMWLDADEMSKMRAR